MPMPSLNFVFKAAAEAAVVRNTRGVLMLILRGNVPAKNPLVIQSTDDILSTTSAANKKYIKLALMGNDYAPKKVIAYFIGTEDSIDKALQWASLQYIDYIAMPTASTENLCETIADWVIAQKTYNNEVKAVLPNCEKDSEYIVNVTTESVTTADGTYTAEELAVRIAGIICGTNATHSITYAVLPEATDCTRLSKTEMDEVVDAGKLIVFFDGEKVKVARGVNSLVTLTENQNSSFKKIKIIETIGIIKKDLRITIQDNYIGKFANTYSNRCVLLTAVQDYLDTLVDEGLISGHDVTFDIASIKAAMKESGIDFSDMTDEEIKAYDFKDKVFLLCKVNIPDAIEDINLVFII